MTELTARQERAYQSTLSIEQLEERYPTAYGNVFCGFYVGPGWLPILDELGAELERLGVHVQQVKEKFGGLRVYTDADGTEEVDTLIREACRRANKTCEECGEPGTLRKGGWLQTLCDEHAARRDVK